MVRQARRLGEWGGGGSLAFTSHGFGFGRISSMELFDERICVSGAVHPISRGHNQGRIVTRYKSRILGKSRENMAMGIEEADFNQPRLYLAKSQALPASTTYPYAQTARKVSSFRKPLACPDPAVTCLCGSIPEQRIRSKGKANHHTLTPASSS